MNVGHEMQRNPLNEIAISAEQLRKAFENLAVAARAVPFLTMKQIAEIRTEEMRIRYGFMRFIVPNYWRWLCRSI